MTHSLITIGTEKVWATDAERDALAVLQDSRGGGCATVHKYQPRTNWIVSPVQTIQFLSRVSTERLYERRIAALKALTYADIANNVNRDQKLSAMTHSDLTALFDLRRQMEIDSMQRTLDGERNDAHRQGHDRCYIHVTKGVKVHLVTRKGDDNLMHPVITNGYPTIASIMVTALFLNVTTHKEGQRKIVNSGTAVRMSNLIKGALNKPGLTLKMLSLKESNFVKLSIDHNTILPDGLKDLAA